MITFNELLERAKREKIVVHTPTEEQSITLLTELDKNGYTWCGGDKLTTETRYKDYKENTCYNFSISVDGNLLCKEVVYSPLDWYQKYGFKIIEFADIDFKENV